jgi:hypothetical protein
MGILDKIKDIEAEMNRTQKNKATEHHIGLMKARLAKLRAQVRPPLTAPSYPPPVLSYPPLCALSGFSFLNLFAIFN